MTGTIPVSRRRPVLMAVIAAAGLVWLAEPAAAQQGWPGVTWESFGTARTLDAAGNLITASENATENGAGVVAAARRDWATGAWRRFPDISGPGAAPVGVTVIADGAGNAMAMWNRAYGTHSPVQAARYDVAADAWEAVVDVSPSGVFPRMSVDAGGNVVAVWDAPVHTFSAARGARYSSATAEWSAVFELAAPAPGSRWPSVAMDPDGNAVATWRGWNGSHYVMQVAHYRAATDDWGPTRALSAPGADAGVGGLVAVDGAGDAFATWVRAGVVQVARYHRATDAWDSPLDLSTGVETVSELTMALNRAGDAILMWSRSSTGTAFARFSPATGSWSSPASAPGGPALAVAIDAAGNAMAIWAVLDFPHPMIPRLTILAGRNPVATGAWAGTSILARLTDFFVFPGIGFDGTGNAVATWSGGGTTWLAAPGAPTIQSVTPRTGTLSVHFTAPLNGEPGFEPSNYEYSMDDGATWVTRAPASTTSPLEIAGLTVGVPYRVRVRAVSAYGSGVPSASVTATPGPAPGPPMNLVTASITGHVVTLRWDPPPNSAVPTGYVIEGGLSPGAVLASLPTGGTAPTFTLVVPPGTFYVRVHAVAGGLRSIASNEIFLLVDVPAPPSAPANLLGLVDGSSVSLSWTTTYAGGVPTNLWVHVTGATAAIIPVPLGDTFAVSGVPPGTYTLRVSASNASGPGAMSNAVTLTIPGSCGGVPEAPTSFAAWTNAATIQLAWRPPATGSAVTGYEVRVTGAYVGTFSTTARTLFGAAGPGRYTISVAATNACGTGPASATQTVVLP